MNKYFVYLESGEDLLKIAVPAENEKAAVKYCEGNGEVLKVKDVTKDIPISADHVAKALKAYGFGQIEIDFITRTLDQARITE